MKTIGVVTDTNSTLAKFLKRNLESIFKGFAEIKDHYIDEMDEKYIIKDDVVLFMIKEKAFQCEKHVLNKENIIIVERTLKGSEIYKIFTLPENTEVLVVNDNRATTLETVSLLYHIGLNHLQLIPYEEGIDFSHIKIAITPDVGRCVPRYISSVINIGNRHIDTSTFINIINKLNIENKVLSERLIEYSESIISLNKGIKENYKQLFVKKEELNIVMNLSNEGVLFIDNNEKIIFYNKAFINIFNIFEDIKDKNIDEVLEGIVVSSFRKGNVKNDILEVNGKYINVNKQIVKYLGQNIGFCFNIQEVTYIKQLEQNLSKKLRNKGLIARYNFNSIKTESSNMKDCINLAKRIANSELTVLITGESGTGKEVLAQSIHNASNREKQPFVAINCAALPENLLESELFGYEGGAFTGALKEGKIGLFEQANNGTIFLDEIGDMPLSLQARILRVLQERQVMKIGSQSVIDINVRVISATNRNLMDMVKEGKFREDLFYRLNVLPINIPSLRNRKEDIMAIMNSFIKNKSLKFSKEVVELLMSYNWPGNVRELQNVASYIELMSNEIVKVEDLPFYILNIKIDFQRELDVIESKVSLYKTIEIMKIIQERNLLNMGVGRKNLEETLKEKGTVITEAEIRRILNILNELAIICSNVGRKGSELTIKGKDFIKWVKNRIE